MSVLVLPPPTMPHSHLRTLNHAHARRITHSMSPSHSPSSTPPVLPKSQPGVIRLTQPLKEKPSVPAQISDNRKRHSRGRSSATNQTQTQPSTPAPTGVSSFPTLTLTNEVLPTKPTKPHTRARSLARAPSAPLPATADDLFAPAPALAATAQGPGAQGTQALQGRATPPPAVQAHPSPSAPPTPRGHRSHHPKAGSGSIFTLPTPPTSSPAGPLPTSTFGARENPGKVKAARLPRTRSQPLPPTPPPTLSQSVPQFQYWPQPVVPYVPSSQPPPRRARGQKHKPNLSLASLPRVPITRAAAAPTSLPTTPLARQPTSASYMLSGAMFGLSLSEDDEHAAAVAEESSGSDSAPDGSPSDDDIFSLDAIPGPKGGKALSKAKAAGRTLHKTHRAGAPIPAGMMLNKEGKVVYAGPQFYNSPAPDSLPMPAFFGGNAEAGPSEGNWF